MEEIFNKAMDFLLSVEGASVTIAIVLDFAFRLIPSDKPKSVVYLAAEVIKKSGEFLVKLGQILDKVLGQKIK
jgi:hypothetical protein